MSGLLVAIFNFRSWLDFQYFSRRPLCWSWFCRIETTEASFVFSFYSPASGTNITACQDILCIFLLSCQRFCFPTVKWTEKCIVVFSEVVVLSSHILPTSNISLPTMQPDRGRLCQTSSRSAVPPKTCKQTLICYSQNATSVRRLESNSASNCYT